MVRSHPCRDVHQRPVGGSSSGIHRKCYSGTVGWEQQIVVQFSPQGTIPSTLHSLLIGHFGGTNSWTDFMFGVFAYMCGLNRDT